MDFNLFDAPGIRQILFYPRSAKALVHPLDNIVDGTFPVEEDVVLGYRLFKNEQSDAPLLLFFHGNGEVASDYTNLSHLFLDLGVSMLVVDYRGYGWSTGEPRVQHLIGDVAQVMKVLPELRAEHGITGEKLLVMGRSLGSAPSIHAAHQFPDEIAGLIVESGFAQLPPLLAQLGLPVQMQASLPDPIGNLRKMTKVKLPVLIIHGERDTLIPVANGQRLYDATPSSNKQIARLVGAGHNDLLLKTVEYFGAIHEFLASLD